MTAAPPRPPGPRPWWETRPFIAALILVSIVPLLYPPVPPLVDLLGHMGRYRVQLDLGDSRWLAQYYEFHWAPIGNLGVDLLVELLGPIFGLELAVKLIVLAIPPLTVTGFLWVAREIHNRIPPTAIFALPLAYCHPFFYGFVNFALSMAFAFLAFGLWLRLGRLGKTRLRAAVFVPISVVVFFTHTFGWGTLGLMCFSAEAVRQHDRGGNWIHAGLKAALHASSMALPIVFMLAWRSSAPAAQTADWFNWNAKLQWIFTVFRDRWKWWDQVSVAVLALVLVECLRNSRLGFSRNLGFSTLFMVLVFILLPRIIFGSAYADMRLAPYLFALALLAVRFRSETHRRTGNILAALGVAFYLARLATTTVSLATAADDQRAKLEALDQVPVGAKVATMVGQGCIDWWAMPRNSHLGAMVIVRRDGFSNDQWDIGGTNLMSIKYEAGAFSSDPSEIVRPITCHRGTWGIRKNRLQGDWRVDSALKTLPRDKFDFLWLVDVAPYDPALTSGMTPVWKGHRSMLYRIDQ